MTLFQFEENYADQNAPFYVNLAKGDCIQFNGVPMFKEEYNLAISKRDLKLFAMGLKPNKYWSFNDTKRYYGLKGKAEDVAEQINEMWEAYKAFKSIYVSHED